MAMGAKQKSPEMTPGPIAGALSGVAGRRPAEHSSISSSAKPGTLPVGVVARYELSGGGEHTLVYVIPAGAGTLLLLFRAPAARYGSASAALERSLAFLRLR